MKNWYQSKTIWANVIAIVVAIGLFFGVSANPTTIQQVLQFLTLALPVVNIGLRLITKQPIALPDSTPVPPIQ